MENKLTPKVTPNAAEGMEYINYYIHELKLFQNKEKQWSLVDVKQLFKEVFAEAHDYVFAKYKSHSFFGGFYLNLDDHNQLKLLHYLSKKAYKLELPPIPDWENHLANLGLKASEFDQEEFRSLAVGFNVLTSWDILPHQQVWFGRFVLYACNNHIDDIFYKGEKYGSYENWSTYFLKQSAAKKMSIVSKLMD